ncbi:type III-A CRISPR-associated protein Csm6 [Streptococcus mitis]|nr:type III-A CRISPR-associated protein Csm6 [Streptococcus mitis]MQQ14514.1 type III-A CRISPR-associated protein Csm6 [Streptococcus mitis]MQQ45212.1 type III-A CRISPR-associated protein Csm6 [Streptococcus mitis]MQQ47196.1 type III-A CRISPR-associated protein Csm6 [Streptococcus mitis]MQQ58655.1 type III-A CRISPR-associated protein Csm6 [Streptococcus mitis]
MKILISAVSDSDPIRGFHDGALVHIARKYRPDKIIIVYSDKMLPNKERNNKVLFSISENYRPEIIIHEKIIIGEDVFIFDKMYDEFSKIINECYSKEDEFILNLSSGTPQICAALFIINRLSGINVKAVQVASPQKGPNTEDKHDLSEDIDDLISLNEDSTDQFVDRTLEDSAEKFSQDLMKKTIRDFITKYDYKASLELANQLPDFSGLKESRKKLQNIVDALDRQDIPQTLKNRKWSDEKKKVLNAYLTIELQKERGNFSEGLIRIKTLTEFILEDYIDNRYPGLLDRYVDESEKYFLGIWDYSKILKEKREWTLYNQIKPMINMNTSRNTLAHRLDPLQSEELRQLGSVLKNLKALVKEQYQFNEKDFNFYKELNKELLELLK